MSEMFVLGLALGISSWALGWCSEREGKEGAITYAACVVMCLASMLALLVTGDRP